MIIEKTGPLSENIEDWLYDNLADWEHNGNFHTFEDGDPSGFGIRSDEWRDF
jgi:hypothetical protein